MRHLLAIAAAAVLAAACGGDEHRGYTNPDTDPQPGQASPASAAPAPPPAPVLTAADSATAQASVSAQADSVRAAMQKVRVLGASEVGRLRQDVNKKQIATARRLGQRASGEAQIRQLVREGRLVALGDSTEFWVLRKMDHSSPYVTPDARANLVEVGRRFHARLDSAGLPHYRMKVTSAIRTDESQADLRRINSYASRIVSAHEFGTTIDVSHERFAVPAPRPGDAAAESRAKMLEEIGKENGKPLQALLGRSLLDLRDAGALHVMIEDQQPVYHFTVARRYPAAPSASAVARSYDFAPRPECRGVASRGLTDGRINGPQRMTARDGMAPDNRPRSAIRRQSGCMISTRLPNGSAT